MRFCVLACYSVPDVHTARRVLKLDELDDESVAKVLFHNRKQQSGGEERLRWDQRMLASMTLIQYSPDKPHIDSMSLATHGETDMLSAYYSAVVRNRRCVSWNGSRDVVPLLHYRALVHDFSVPEYWQAVKDDADLHFDLATWLTPPRAEIPQLDTIARQLGLPGTLGCDEEATIDAWLEGRTADLSACSDVAAFNVFLLALRVFAMTGELTRHDIARVKVGLRDELQRRQESHYSLFDKVWGKD